MIELRRTLLRLAAVGLCAAMTLTLTGCRLVHASPQVAFLGDSITEGWRYPAVNYGVHGNTTAQMIARFPRLIPGRGYSTVVVLGGTNDVLESIDPDTTIRNLERLGEETVEQHAEPILCEIPPIFHSFRRGDTRDYDPRVLDLNQRIVQLAARHHWRLVDYYTPMAGHPEYSSDGVHMRRRGYLVMEQALLGQLSVF